MQKSRKIPKPQPSEWEAYTFLQAAVSGNIAVVTQFLDQYPAAIDVKNAYGTALGSSAESGLKAMTELLLQRGASVDAVSTSGITPLMRAADGGFTDIARLLLDHGAAIDHRNDSGQTPLMFAAESGAGENLETVGLLLERGADCGAKDEEGSTALSIARDTDADPELIALLEQWPEKLRAAKKARELAKDLADFSPALKRDMPAPRALKVPRPRL